MGQSRLTALALMHINLHVDIDVKRVLRSLQTFLGQNKAYCNPILVFLIVLI